MSPRAAPEPVIHVGAYHADAWSGLILSAGAGRGFRMHVAYESRDGARAELADFFWITHEVGPHAPDGSYARMRFDVALPLGLGNETPVVERAGRDELLTVEWSRIGPRCVGLRAQATRAGWVELVLDLPWDWQGTVQAEPGGAQGRTQPQGEVLVVRSAAPAAPAAHDRRLVLRVPASDTLRVVAGLGPPGWDVAEARDALDPLLDTLDDLLVRAEAGYAARRVLQSGPHAQAPAAVTQALHWTVLLQPDTGRRYTPAGRRWIFPTANGGPDDWTVFGWDSWFNALQLALEAPDAAWSALEAGLATQYPDGCVPNWRGRGGGTPDRAQPPLASYAALRLDLRHPDPGRLAALRPALERWARWWRRRDGRREGLYQWGSDPGALSATPPPWEVDASGRQRAAWESGQDDLPLWDDVAFDEKAHTLRMDCVDLCAYRALDLECLAAIARRSGDPDAAQRWEEERTRLCARMDERLWSEADGLYRCRGWDGTWAPRPAASDFLPLVAGVPSHARAARMVEALTDPGRWWTPWPVPTVARDHPAFPDQQYWRGSIWPPLNYLLAQGLRRYGFDREASVLADRSARMFLEDRRRFGLCRENFDARSGAGAGQRHQSWGPLFALSAVEELLDVTPWDGLTLGTPVATEPVSLLRVPVQGAVWDVRSGPEGLRIAREGRAIVESDVPVRLRHVEVRGDVLAADVDPGRPVSVIDSDGDTHRLGPGPQRLRIPLARRA